MHNVPRHLGVRYLLELRDGGHSALIDPNAFSAALAFALLSSAGLDSDADRAIDAYASSFAASQSERDTLAAIARDAAHMERGE